MELAESTPSELWALAVATGADTVGTAAAVEVDVDARLRRQSLGCRMRWPFLLSLSLTSSDGFTNHVEIT